MKNHLVNYGYPIGEVGMSKNKQNTSLNDERSAIVTKSNINRLSSAFTMSSLFTLAMKPKEDLISLNQNEKKVLKSNGMILTIGIRIQSIDSSTKDIHG